MAIFFSCIEQLSIKTKIHEAEILDLDKTKKEILGKISHYKRRAPFYKNVVTIIKETFSNTQSTRLRDLSVSGLTTVSEYLGLRFRPVYSSSLSIKYPAIVAPGEWAYCISRHLGARQYINPAGGRHLFDSKKYLSSEYQLVFLKPTRLYYQTNGYTFEQDLSILDALMWMSPEAINGNLEKGYSLLE